MLGTGTGAGACAPCLGMCDDVLLDCVVLLPDVVLPRDVTAQVGSVEEVLNLLVAPKAAGADKQSKGVFLTTISFLPSGVHCLWQDANCSWGLGAACRLPFRLFCTLCCGPSGGCTSTSAGTGASRITHATSRRFDQYCQTRLPCRAGIVLSLSAAFTEPLSSSHLCTGIAFSPDADVVLDELNSAVEGIIGVVQQAPRLVLMRSFAQV